MVTEELKLNDVSVSKNSKFLVEREIYNGVLTYYYISGNGIYMVYVNVHEVVGFKKLERTSGLYNALLCVFNDCNGVENYFKEDYSGHCGYLFWAKLNRMGKVSTEVLFEAKCFDYSLMKE